MGGMMPPAGHTVPPQVLAYQGAGGMMPGQFYPPEPSAAAAVENSGSLNVEMKSANSEEDEDNSQQEEDDEESCDED